MQRGKRVITKIGEVATATQVNAVERTSAVMQAGRLVVLEKLQMQCQFRDRDRDRDCDRRNWKLETGEAFTYVADRQKRVATEVL
jgi:hypothetical protein